MPKEFDPIEHHNLSDGRSADWAYFSTAARRINAMEAAERQAAEPPQPLTPMPPAPEKRSWENIETKAKEVLREAQGDISVKRLQYIVHGLDESAAKSLKREFLATEGGSLEEIAARREREIFYLATEQNWSVERIVEDYNVSRSEVERVLRKNGIPFVRTRV